MMRSEEKPQVPVNPQDRCRAIQRPDRSTWPDETSESTSAINRGRSELGMRLRTTPPVPSPALREDKARCAG